MNLSLKKKILLSLIHRFRLSSNEGFHTSRFVKERNYYDVLNLDHKCDAKEIRDSFLHLAKKYHPDTNQNDPKSHARFVELKEAYTVLSTPSKRRNYDLGLSGVSMQHNNPYKGPRGAPSDARAYEDYFNDEYKDLFYRSRMKPNANPPRLRVGILQITLLFVAFTTVGAVIQYYVIKQDPGQNFPKPSPVTSPDLSDRPFFLRWLYRRNYDDEMERHHRGSASYHALKDAMEKQQEEFDIQKLRASYYKEIGHGPIGMQLVPALIRPKVPSQPPENFDSKMEKSLTPLNNQKSVDIK